MMRFFLNGLVASSFLRSKKDLIGFFASRHHCASRRKKQAFVTNLNWLCGRHFISVWCVAHEVQSFQAGLVLYALLHILRSRTLDDSEKCFHC